MAQAGADALAYHDRSLARRLPASLRSICAQSEDEARALLHEHCDLLPSVVSSLIIGVTEFFRDAPVFESLRREVLPTIARRGGPLRVWSAGCSSGAELYSVAMLLAEAGMLEGACLLGTDLRGDAVDQARAGVFDGTDVERVDPVLRHRYFERLGKGWQVTQLLREATSWRVSNLVREQPPGSWDIILYRNLAIYFGQAVAGDLWARLTSALSPEGFLVVGKAERPPSSVGLTPVSRCIYRRID